MRCNHCGNEFGESLNCQHCGIDRVEGLGTFNGFHPNSKSDGPLTPGITTPGGITVSNSDKMLCFSCGEIIPGEADFCPFCGKEQYVRCPKCDFRYLAKFPNCYKCGANRREVLQQIEIERNRKIQEEAERKRIEALRRQEEDEKRKREEVARRRQEQERERIRAEQEAQTIRAIGLATDAEMNWVSRFVSNNSDQLSKYYKEQETRRVLCTASVYIIVGLIVIAIFSSIRFLGSDVYERGMFGIFGGFVLAFLNGALGVEAIKFNNENKAIVRYIQKAYNNDHGSSLRYTTNWLIITTCIKHGVKLEVPTIKDNQNLDKVAESQKEVDINWTTPFIVTAILGILFSIFILWPYPPIPKGSASYSGTAVVTMGDPLSSNTKKQNVPISKMMLSFDSRKGFIIYSAYSLELTIKRMYREGAEIHIVLEERDMKNPVKGSKLGDGISAVYDGVIHSFGSFSGSGQNWKGQYFSFELKPIQ